MSKIRKLKQGFDIQHPAFSIYAAFFVMMLLILPYIASAQGLVPCGGEGQNPCTICDFGILVINITNFLIYNIAIPLAGLMILIGGLMIVLGAASEGRVEVGKKMLTNAVIGIIIVFTAWLLVDTVFKVLTGRFEQRSFFGTFGPWNRLPAGSCPFGGGGISAPNPLPPIQPPSPQDQLIVEGPEGPDQRPLRRPEDEPDDFIFEDTVITVDPKKKTANVGNQKTGEKKTFDISGEGAGIALVREKYPNVFVMGEKDLSLQDAVKLKAALDEAAAMLPASYDVKNKIVFVPTDRVLAQNLWETAGGKGSVTTQANASISKNNVIVFNGVAYAQSEGISLTAWEQQAPGGGFTSAQNNPTFIMVHELAHVAAKEVTGGFSGGADWMDLHYGVETQKTGFITGYAKTNASEDLAETITVATLALSGKAKAYTGDSTTDVVLQKKYEYLKKNGLIKAIPQR